MLLDESLPQGWEIVNSTIATDLAGNATGSITVDLSGPTPLPAGPVDLVRLAATVPETAIFNESQRLAVTAGAIDGNNDPIAIEGSSAVHKVAFLGDPNGDGSFDSGDAFDVLLESAGVITGFDTFDLTDPAVIADSNGDLDLDSGDAFDILLAAVGLGIITPVPENFEGPEQQGPDPTVSIATVEDVTPGQQDVQVDVRLGNVEPEAVGLFLQGAELEIVFDTEFLAITDSSSTPGPNFANSPDVNLDFFDSATETVVDAEGRIRVSATRNVTNLFPLAADTDVSLGTITFDVADNVPVGASLAINVSPMPDSSLIGRDDNFARVDLELSVVDGGIMIASPPANSDPEITSDPAFSVAENTTAVGTVTATDADDDTLTFSLSGGVDQNAFAIDANTGALSFTTAPDFEAPADDGGDNVYNVQVSVSDGTAAPVNQDLTVTVTNDPVDDPPPIDPVNVVVNPDAEGLIGDGLIFDTSPAGDNEVTVQLADDVLNLGNAAQYDNLIGFYQVADTNGGIDTDDDGTADLNPGDAGYARAAITNRVPNFVIRAGSEGAPDANTTVDEFGNVVLAGGNLYAPFVIANGGARGDFDDFVTAEDAEPNGEFNDGADGYLDPVTYFSFIGANPDGVEHLQARGNNIFGFEDVANDPSVGLIPDNDFDDAIFSFNFS